MRKHQKANVKTNLGQLSRFMSGLFPDQKRLTEIQAVYDNLTLLGQLLGAGTDITRMREDFSSLASVLLDQLAKEHYKKATLNLSSCARVAIDVLTRNLFERTADIGFLATDSEICAFAEAVEADMEARHDPQWQSELRSRFTEYVQKYSVYHNIILLSPQGEVLVQHDGNNPATLTTDRFLAEALTTEAGYVEVLRRTDLLPGDDSPLIYAYRVMSGDGSHPVGVLCLCFRLQDECQRIFESLVSEDDWTIITLLDASGRIIASSDPYQFPVGVQIEPASDDDCRIIRFAGREYLATTRPTHGYQGYSGPGWLGHAMAPLNHAFEMSEAHELERVPDDFLNCVLETSTLFSQDLRDIPVKAARIQQELNRAVWNGNIWLARESAAHNADFAKVLLREIGSTGIRTRNVYSESTTNLYKTVVSSVLFDCETQSALAIDIMDRNLYERANDCRWWALTRIFREELSRIDPSDREQRRRLTEVLKKINSLYTVYSNLVLFDQSGRVVAVSDPAYNDWIGKPLTESWVRPTLGLRDTQSYAASRFSASALYAGEHTYVFTAAVREPGGTDPVGGIAIVFDSTPQFQAMLHDALPRQAGGALVPGAFAVFAERDGRVICSTDPELVPGTKMVIGYEFFNLQHGESYANIIEHNGCYYAVGSCMSAGYREYKSAEDANQNDVVALIFSPLSDRLIDAESLHSLRDIAVDTYALRQTKGADTVDIASFYIGKNWYGIRTSSVVEAIDDDRLTPMPGAPDLVEGCLMYNDQALTIFNLSAIVSPHRPGEERRSRRDPLTSKRQVLILHSPQNDQVRFGILVDNLGDITEIPTSQIESIPGMLSDGNSLLESLVKPREDNAERRILMVLSVEKVFARLSEKEFA
ncbi:CheW-like domain protein [mine drainage metagenome]|uniref:CheW-like domain protein n=1 Tax=mine drainage metagenome TaxID=410659 RepID=A0A1J5RCJ0_9ZZZZ